MGEDNPMVAGVEDSTTPTTGLWLLDDAQGLIDSIESGTWVDTTIGGISAGLSTLSVAMDPLGAIASMAIGWLMEHVKPLREALDKLTGDADKVNSFAATWTNVSTKLQTAASNLKESIGKDLPNWESEASSAYDDHAGYTTNGVGGISAAAAILAAATSGAGMLVATVREIVRDLIADCVATLVVRVPKWIAEVALTLGIGTPWVISQAASLIAKWVGRITSFLNALITSMSNLKLLLG